MPQIFLSRWLGIGREVLYENPKKDLPLCYRKFVDSVKELQKYIKYQEKRGNPCYISVNPFERLHKVKFIEKLYFDFDCEEDPEKADAEALRFRKILKELRGIEALQVFSGNKGSNVYVWLQYPLEIKDEEESKNILSMLMKSLIFPMNFSTLDSSSVGDISRLSRILYTRHEASGKICLPKDFMATEEGDIDLDFYRQNGVSSEFVDLQVFRMHEQESFRKAGKGKIFEEPKRNGDFGVRPCIRKALELRLEGDKGHFMRIVVAREFLNAGCPEEKVAGLFNFQKDFDFNVSLKKVKEINKKRMRGVKCLNIINAGFCLGEGCYIFRRRR